VTWQANPYCWRAGQVWYPAGWRSRRQHCYRCRRSLPEQDLSPHRSALPSLALCVRGLNPPRLLLRQRLAVEEQHCRQAFCHWDVPRLLLYFPFLRRFRQGRAGAVRRWHFRDKALRPRAKDFRFLPTIRRKVEGQPHSRSEPRRRRCGCRAGCRRHRSRRSQPAAELHWIAMAQLRRLCP
jgi:hypothetical protein